MNIPDSRQQTELTAQVAARTRNAFRVSQVMLGAAVVLFLYNLYTAILDPVWQQFAIVGVSLVMGVASAVSIWLSRRGRSEWSAGFAIGGVLLVCLAGALLFKGLGLLLGAAAVILTAMIAGQVLFQRQAARAVAAGVLAGLLALFVDLSEPAWRISAVSPTTATIIAAALMLIYGVFVVRQFAHYTLRTKLIIAFLVVSLIPLGLAFYLNNRTMSASIAANVGASLKNVANSKATAIGDQLARQVDRLRTLGSSKSLEYELTVASGSYTGSPETILSGIEELDRKWQAAVAANDEQNLLIYIRLINDVAAEMNNFRASFPEHVEVFATDKYGALVGATNRTSDYNQADEGWWQAAWNNGKGSLYIGEPAYDESSRAFSVIVALPVYDTDKAVTGILRTTFRVDALTQLLASNRLGQTGRAELYLPGGRVLTDSGEKAPPDPETLAKLQAITGDYGELDYEGTPKLVSRALIAATTEEKYITDLGWSVVIYQDRAESLAPVQAQTRSALLLALVIAGLVAGGGVFVAQVLANPIARLTAVAAKVAQGDLTAQATVETRDEVGALAGAFNTMVAQLRQTLAGLEWRVAERTRELERRATQIATAAQVARVATTALDPEQLTAQVVELVRTRFDYYYVGLFLVDADSRYAVLRAGSDEAGRIMKERGHRLEIGGQSMVGWACANGQARIALDVGDEPMRFDNPLLPDTRSEMALPLRAGGRVVGVLDVQSTRAAAFDQSDIAALQGMADQVGVALENARLFQQSQRVVKELDEANRLLVGQGWQDYLTSVGGERHVEFSAEGARTIETSGYTLHIPVELRGQPIGTLVMERGEGALPWTDGEAEAIRAIVQQAALALDGARLFEETQRRAARERLINEITSRIRGSVTMEGVLNSAVREISQVTGADFATIELELAEPE